MLKIYYIVSMLHGVHGSPDMKVVEIGPIDTLDKCAHIAIAMIQNAPTFQTYCQQREAKAEGGLTDEAKPDEVEITHCANLRRERGD
jgi:hypothetical protein